MLVVDTLLEQLAFLDASSLRRKNALDARKRVPEADSGVFIRAVLSQDGFSGVVVSRDVNGILSSDSAFFFRTATGEIIDVESVGSQPGCTGITPDGKTLAVANYLNNVHLIGQAVQLDVPRFVSSATQFTGISLVNVSPGSLVVWLEAISLDLRGTFASVPTDQSAPQP